MAKRNIFETMPFERYTFENERISFTMALSKSDFERMKGWEFQRYEAEMGSQMVYRLSRLMAHGDKEVKSSEDVPVSWWDHLKLDINLWARHYIIEPHFFFTNIARAITRLRITPKFRKIKTSVLIKNFCPHFDVGDNRPHIDFMMHKPLDMSELLNVNDYR